MNIAVDQHLRGEIGYLGEILGDTIRQFAGEEALSTVEELRRVAWNRRIGREAAEARMTELIAELDAEQIRVVVRAFTVFLDLLNLVEDRRRVRVLNQRARDVYPGPRVESIRDAVASLKSAGKSASSMQELIDHLHIALVFTAHPTDAKRRSVRMKLSRLRELLAVTDGDPLPELRDRTDKQIRGEIAKLWQTDFIRPWRPSVMQEVGRGLSIKPVLWKEIPRIARELRQALGENYGDDVHAKRPPVTFGSWIGGDRDGHPGVTADVTEETFVWLRREAIAFHLNACDELFDSLSLSQRQVQLTTELEPALGEACARWEPLDAILSALPPGELCRRWLRVVRWRLEQTRELPLHGDRIDGAYDSACDLAADVMRLASALSRTTGNPCAQDELAAWQAQIETFGFHLARLDVRQNAQVYREVMNELLLKTELSDAPETLDEAARVRLLEKTIDSDLMIDEDEVSPQVTESVAMFRILHRVASAFSRAAMGTHVISMTGVPSDVLTVLWLWNQTNPARPGDAREPGLPIVPLLETIEDLQRGPEILRGMLAIPAYREHLRRQGDQQIIMLGYSDSTKDGGYLSACWSLQQAQLQLVDVATQHGIEIVFFHGRGGSLGRGGGPAARSILSLPQGTFHGSMRLTEQGEVLADRYDDPAIAHRHLEQVIWSSLLAAGVPNAVDSDRWRSIMDELSRVSFEKYRDLLEQPDFIPFFRAVTPISGIEQLPIGSRPSRRKPGGGLADLRAIPWVFSWTQSRCLIPAWYGIGAAMSSAINDDQQRNELRTMYRDWPFFRAMIDNAELALAKTDLAIAKHYADLAPQKPTHTRIANMITEEYRQSCRAILAVTEHQTLLDGTPWLQESIRVRNRFIDPLNLIQVELLRRGQEDSQNDDESEELRHLTRLSINGVAAGMRTSG